jgi:transposase
MITVEAWTTIRYLSAQGKSIRGIAKELGVSRNTVRAALDAETPPHYSRPARPNPKLAPFLKQIEDMAVEQHLIGSRIIHELRLLGYDGGTTPVYEYLRGIKLAANKRVTERYETGPGEQGQFDWSFYTVMLGDVPTKVVVFGLILSYSRRKFYWPSLDATQPSIYEALEAGLRYFGGAPLRLLVDNDRSLVTDADPARFTWNSHFLELCGHYRIEPVACQPGRPQTKGKIERPFFYLEEHFIKGHTWPDFDAFGRALAAFVTDELDLVVHATTRQRPLDLFEAERPALTSLPEQPFVGSHEILRTVSYDCLVPFAGSRYSVPWQYARQKVWLRPSQGSQLAIRNLQGVEIARHRFAAQRGLTVLDPAHYAGLRQDAPRTWLVAEQAFRQRFPDLDGFLTGLRTQHPNNALSHLRAILALAEIYPATALRFAFARAEEYNTYSQHFIRSLVSYTEARSAPVAVSSTPPLPAARLTADLRVYQCILEAAR